MDERGESEWERITREMWEEENIRQQTMPPSVRVMPYTFAGLNPGELFNPHAYTEFGTERAMQDMDSSADAFFKGMAIHEEIEKEMTNPTQPKPNQR